MNWNSFLKSLGALNQALSATSEKKEDVYNILVEHNEKAEKDLLIRLTSRKRRKRIDHSDNIGGTVTMTNQQRINREDLAQLRNDFPKGTAIILEKMDDLYTDMPKGLKGVVTSVDDAGTIHAHWENGSSLGVVYGEDHCRKVNQEG